LGFFINSKGSKKLGFAILGTSNVRVKKEISAVRLRAVVLILTLSLGLIAVPRAAMAQEAEKIPRIGVLSFSGCDLWWLNPFREGLHELGYVEGENFVIECRNADGKLDRLAMVAAALVQSKVDIIFTVSTRITQAAVNATKTIPIVFSFVGDPVGSGFVENLARPGRNATGFSTLGVDISSKWLQLIKEAVPNTSRVAVLSDPQSSFGALALREIKVAARVMGLQLQILGVQNPDEFDNAFAAMAREQADALLVPGGTLFPSNRVRLAKLALKYRLPDMHTMRAHAEAGSFMVYAANFADLVRRAAFYVDRILKGTDPAELPVQQPTKFELIINLKTAKALGITIPQSLLIQATDVIE
jgi:putative ABC transport system substrate-binding protein